MWDSEHMPFVNSMIIYSRLSLNKGHIMNTKLVATCFVMASLFVPVAAYAADGDTDRSHPMSFVKDSVITTKVKARLAEEKVASLMHVKVDTDAKGAVVLSGTVKT